MGKVLKTLYGSNLDCNTFDDVFRISSQVFQIEHKLSEVKRNLPHTMQLVNARDIQFKETLTGNLLRVTKFRVILTLRYHNTRILTHRPLLQKYLDMLSHHTAGSTGSPLAEPLRQVGVNSLRICTQSATSIVELMAHVLSSKENRALLGAWWFSLYYGKFEG